jgi:hypothetical protein
MLGGKGVSHGTYCKGDGVGDAQSVTLHPKPSAPEFPEFQNLEEHPST